MRYPVLLMTTLAISSLLVACNKSDATKTATAGAAAAAQQMPPSVVNVMPVTFQSIPLVKRLSGRTVASQEATVVPQATGIITQQLFKQGDFVKQGQALYRLNQDNYTSALAGSQAQLSQAQAGIQTAKANYNNAVAAHKSRVAELELAQANYQRIASLKNTDAISRQELDVAATTVKTAKAAVENAVAQIGVAQAGIDAANAAALGAQQTINSNKLNINRTVVTAPMSGIIRQSNVDVGTLVTTGQTQMTTIARLDTIFVDISQSAAEMLELQQMQRQGNIAAPNSAAVRLILANGSTYPILGQLSFADQKVDQTTGSVTLRAVFKNNGALLPGMFVNAEVIQGEVNNAVLLPQSAINRTAKGETTVYIVGADNKIQVRPVTLNGTHNGQWIVTSGLQQGDNVVIVGGAKVKPDQQVEVKPYVMGDASATGSATGVTNSPTNAAANQTTTTQQTTVAPNAAPSAPNSPATASSTATAKQ